MTAHAGGADFQGRARGLGLEKDKIGPARQQTFHLLGDHFVVKGFVLRPGRQGTDGSGHEHGPAGRVGRLAGDRRADAIYLPHLFGKPKLRQSCPIRSKGIRGKHVCAGVAIFAVNGSDQFGIGKTQLVKAAIGKHMMPVDLRTHRAVENQIAPAQGLLESCRDRHLKIDSPGRIRPGQFESIYCFPAAYSRRVKKYCRTSLISIIEPPACASNTTSPGNLGLATGFQT